VKFIWTSRRQKFAILVIFQKTAANDFAWNSLPSPSPSSPDPSSLSSLPPPPPLASCRMRPDGTRWLRCSVPVFLASVSAKGVASRRPAPALPAARPRRGPGSLASLGSAGRSTRGRKKRLGRVRPSHARETEFGAGRRAPRVDVSVHPSIVPCSAPDDTFFDSFFPQERIAT